MGWRVYDHVKDAKVLKDICCNCGSASVKKTYQYFSAMIYYSKGNYWCEIIDDKAFYFACKQKNMSDLLLLQSEKNNSEIILGKRFCLGFYHVFPWQDLTP